MEKNTISLILFPILVDGISFKQKEALKKIFHNVPSTDMEKLFKKRISRQEVEKLAKNLTDAEKKAIFKEAKEIAEIDYITRSQFEEFAEFGNLLGISRDDCGFDINIYDKNDILEYEYKRTLTNFSLISSAVAFVPVPFTDLFLITPLQIAMVAKISTLLDFEINSTGFIKMITGVIGTGLALRTTSRILAYFLPFKWITNAAVAYAGTYAMGILVKNYIEAGGSLTEEAIQEIWANSFEEGKTEAFKIKDILLSNKDILLKRAKEYINLKNMKQAENDYDDKEAGNTIAKKKTAKKSAKKA